LFSIFRSLTLLGLSLRFRCFRLYLSLSQKEKSSSDRLTPIEKLQLQAGVESDDRLLNWLQVQLRLVPYWYEGHCAVADLALKSGRRDLALASAFAAQELASSSQGHARARLLMARCYLALREFSEAEQILKALLEVEPFRVEYLEELGAVYLAQGRFSQAAERLQLIPESRRTAPVCSALRYLEQQSPTDSGARLSSAPKING